MSSNKIRLYLEVRVMNDLLIDDTDMKNEIGNFLYGDLMNDAYNSPVMNL
ncbi:hypothetical protein MACH16_11400 [Marinomonas pontica]|uniref:Uncharacterized protein n=1 Tax=Marinomonas pontica TaxID=264739 RepID=A0ABN6WLG8_9GAMM|nr:hypothetical protein MACH16_11400 [Marinomonas pontica]